MCIFQIWGGHNMNQIVSLLAIPIFHDGIGFYLQSKV